MFFNGGFRAGLSVKRGGNVLQLRLGTVQRTAQSRHGGRSCGVDSALGRNGARVFRSVIDIDVVKRKLCRGVVVSDGCKSFENGKRRQCFRQHVVRLHCGDFGDSLGEVVLLLTQSRNRCVRLMKRLLQALDTRDNIVAVAHLKSGQCAFRRVERGACFFHRLQGGFGMIAAHAFDDLASQIINDPLCGLRRCGGNTDIDVRLRCRGDLDGLTKRVFDGVDGGCWLHVAQKQVRQHGEASLFNNARNIARLELQL